MLLPVIVAVRASGLAKKQAMLAMMAVGRRACERDPTLLSKNKSPAELAAAITELLLPPIQEVRPGAAMFHSATIKDTLTDVLATCLVAGARRAAGASGASNSTSTAGASNSTSTAGASNNTSASSARSSASASSARSSASASSARSSIGAGSARSTSSAGDAPGAPVGKSAVQAVRATCLVAPEGFGKSTILAAAFGALQVVQPGNIEYNLTFQHYPTQTIVCGDFEQTMRGRILFVDDAHELDVSSWHALEEMMRAGHINALVSACDSRPEWVTDAWQFEFVP